MEPQNNKLSAPDPSKTSHQKENTFTRFCQKALKSDLFWNCAIFFITLAAFLPAVTYTDLISDDRFYLLNVISVSNDFMRIFDPVLELRTPLTALSLYADYLIWGKEHFLSGAHFINILLHCGSALLFFKLLRSLKWGERQLTPGWAGMTALIFALHPQRVESVAWLCERKDCLAMCLGLAALLFFLSDMRKDKMSWKSALLLLLSFLAKPMWLFFIVPAATLIWSERRTFQWKLYLKLLLPSLFLFLAFAGTYLYGALSTPANPGMATPLFFKVETILYNCGNYFVRTFLPGNLFPLYPYYDPSSDPRWMALVPAALCLVPFLAREKSFRPALFYGVIPVLICFAAVLLPVMGLIRVGNTDFADRYSYLPSLFLLTGAAFLLKLNIPRASSFGRWMPILGILYCGGLLYKTIEYLPVWKTGQSVIERSAAPAVPNFNAAISKAVDLYSKGEYAKALDICKNKLPESPHYPEDFKNIIRIFKLSLQGLIHFKQGQPDKGITFLNTVYMSSLSGMVRNFPISFARQVFVTGAEYHLKKYGNKKGAANLYYRCSVLFKGHSALYGAFYAGMAALTEEKYAEAVKHFKLACDLAPGNQECRQNLNLAINKMKEQKK